MKAILKTCCDCGETKPLGRFSKRGKEKGNNRHPYCIECGRVRGRSLAIAKFVPQGVQLDSFGVALQSWCVRP